MRPGLSGLLATVAIASSLFVVASGLEGAGEVLAADGGGRLRVGLVLEPAGVDEPFQHVAFVGLERAARELGVHGRVLTPSPREGYVPSLSLLARQRYDLVIAIGFLQISAVDTVARKFPRTRFAILDVPHEALAHRPKNVQGVVFKAAEAAYLAGYLAARLEMRRPGRDVVSSVGGISIPPVDSFIAGYQAGARRASPGVTVLNGYAQSFLDPEKCKNVALSQIAKGSGVVFNVAGACGLGALEAARQKSVWGIGVDADQSFLGPHILTSVVKRLDLAVFTMIEELQTGTLTTGGTTVLSLRDGGVGLGKISPRVPRSILAEVERIRRRIVAGEIEVPATLR